MGPKRGNILVIVLAILLLVSISIAGYLFWQNRQSQQTPQNQGASSSNTTINPTPQTKNIPAVQPDITANWKAYKYSPSISFKLPTNISDPLYVNTGHYAVETILPKGTRLQIYGADGPSPTGKPLDYNQLKQQVMTDRSLISFVIPFMNFESVSFSSPILQGKMTQANMVWGGEVYYKINGTVIKTNQGALVVTHYSPTTGQQWNESDYQEDESVVGQILSTFKFVGQNNGSEIWQSYVNQGAFFSLEYPQNWTKSDIVSGKTIGEKFVGPEGDISIYWGGGFGGGPCQNNLVIMTTKYGPVGFCDAVSQNGTEVLREANEGPGFAPSGSAIMVIANIASPATGNRLVLEKIISSLDKI